MRTANAIAITWDVVHYRQGCVARLRQRLKEIDPTLLDANDMRVLGAIQESMLSVVYELIDDGGDHIANVMDYLGEVDGLGRDLELLKPHVS